MNKQKTVNPILMTILFFVGFVLVGYISLLAGAYVETHEGEVLINAFLMFPDLIKENPLAIKPFNADAIYLGMSVYLVCWLIGIGNYYMNKNTMVGREFGTSRFMSADEIKDWRKKYMDKQIYTEGLPSALELAKENKSNAKKKK
jgi:hypothetical protein